MKAVSSRSGQASAIDDAVRRLAAVDHGTHLLQRPQPGLRTEEQPVGIGNDDGPAGRLPHEPAHPDLLARPAIHVRSQPPL